MAEYRVLKQFRLLDDVNVPDIGPVYNPGDVIDIKVKRADEVVKTLDSSFLERIDKNDNTNDDEEIIGDNSEAEETPKEE